MSSLIAVENLDIGYDKPIASNISFQLASGNVLHINGRNGSGKTTLLRTLLKQIRPLNGQLNTNGTFTYLPQLVQNFQHFSLTLEEILECSDVHTEIMKLFTPELLKTRWQDASGGQRQRTLIASRIHSSPEILVLDEPFNHLDQQAITEVSHFLLHMLQHEYIKALILVSHIAVEGMNPYITKVDL